MIKIPNKNLKLKQQDKNKVNINIYRKNKKGQIKKIR